MARPATSLPSSQPSLIYRFGQRWELLLDILAVMWPMRVSILVLVGGAILLVTMQPAQDALTALVENVTVAPDWPARWDGIGRFLLFLCCWFFWAFSTFYAARFMSRLPPRGRIAYLDTLAAVQANPFHIYPPPRLRSEHAFRLARSVPRALGGAVVVVTAVALIRAIWDEDTVAPWCLVIASSAGLFVSYLLVVVNRRDLLNSMVARLSMPMRLEGFLQDIEPAFHWPLWCRAMLLATGAIVISVFLASAWLDLDVGSPVVRTTILILGAVTCLLVLLVALFTWGKIKRSTKTFVAVLLVLTMLPFIAGLWPGAPLAVAVLHSPAVVMLAAGGLAATGTFLLALPAEITGFPILLVVLLLAVGFSTIGSRDNHQLRMAWPKPAAVDPIRPVFPVFDPLAGCPVLDPPPLARADAPPDALSQAFTRWCSVAARPERRTRTLPLVIVATAGGASRAAYWTMVVLGALEQRIPNFHDDVFAISSVSGGTLGAAVYRLSLDLPGTPEQRQGRLRDMLKQDFLSALLLGAAYPDLLQRILPGSLLPDRAAALESAWEVQWARAVDAPDIADDRKDWMRESFRTRMNSFVSKPRQWRPIMLFNGTSAVTGRRIITSNMPTGAGFPTAYDLFADYPQTSDIRVSTAIHNSARFPYLDAAGDLEDKQGRIVDRIVDGGYFENNGAATAVDLLEQLIDRGAFRAARDQPDRVAIVPVVIQITNDPDAPKAAPLGTGIAPCTKPVGWTERTLADATVPVAGFYHTRAGLGERATEALRRRLAYLSLAPGQVTPDDGRYVQFGIWDKDISMSWLLSDHASTLIDRELPLLPDGKTIACATPTGAPENCEAFNRLSLLIRDDVMPARPVRGATPPADVAARECARQ